LDPPLTVSHQQTTTHWHDSSQLSLDTAL